MYYHIAFDINLNLYSFIVEYYLDMKIFLPKYILMKFTNNEHLKEKLPENNIDIFWICDIFYMHLFKYSLINFSYFATECRYIKAII